MAAALQPTNRRTSLGWRIAAYVGVGVVFLGLTLGTRLFAPVLRGLDESAAIVHRSREYHQQVRDNQALEAQVQYLRTDAGKQWAAWRYLGMVKPGQQVGRAVESPPPPSPAPSRAECVRSWITDRQTRSALALREAGEVLSCYFGRRPLDAPPVSNRPSPAMSKKSDRGQMGRGSSSAKPEGVRSPKQ